MAFGTLTVYHPNGHQEQVMLAKPTERIGRAADNDIVLEHETVSSYHAQLLCAADGCQLLDLDSANGTFVTGERLTPQTPHAIADGALIQIGAAALTYGAPPGTPARGPSASSSVTVQMPVGAVPPLPPGVPPQGNGLAPSAVAPTAPSSAPSETARMPAIMAPPAPATPVGQAPPPAAQGMDATMRMPVVQSAPTPANATPSGGVAPARAWTPPGGPPPSASNTVATPPVPRRGWSQPPLPSTVLPPARLARRTATWFVPVGIVVTLLTVLAGGLWGLLPSLRGGGTSPSVTPSASASVQASPDPGADGSAPAAVAESPEPSILSAPTPTPPKEPGELYVVAAVGYETLVVRDGPGTQGTSKVGSVRNGTEVRVVGEPKRVSGEQWVRIEGKDRNGNDISGWCLFGALRKR